MSLYLPGDNDGIPLTADAIGIDKGGHTTWHVGLGTPSGTFTATSGYPTASGVFQFSLPNHPPPSMLDCAADVPWYSSNGG